MSVVCLFEIFALIWRRHHASEGLQILTYARRL